MIVIATNNGLQFLPNLLKSIELHGTDNHKICIVDTGSTDVEFLTYLNSLDKTKYIVTATPFKGYDTGAYIYAYRNFDDTEYIFLQDSLEVLTDDWISEFKRNNPDVCYYNSFNMCYDNNEQIERLISIGIYNSSTNRGVFGPIFYIKKSILDLISQKFNLDAVIPQTKMDQMGMERGWSMMINSVTSNITWLSDFTEWCGRSNNGTENPTIMYRTLKKYRPQRGLK